MTVQNYIFVEDEEKPCRSCKDTGTMHHMNNGVSVADRCDQCSAGPRVWGKWAEQERLRRGY